MYSGPKNRCLTSSQTLNHSCIFTKITFHNANIINNDQGTFVKQRWAFLDNMECNLKDVLNYYENFCNQLADFENEFGSDKENTPPHNFKEPSEFIENMTNKKVLNQLEIIEEKESIPTTSEYSPMDRVETEPIRCKRESCSSLFRRSKAARD